MSGATLSISTVVFPENELPGDRAFAWLQRIGLRSAEVGPDHARRIHASEADRTALQDSARSHEVRLASLHAWTRLVGVEGPCETAAAVGAGRVVVHAPHDALASAFSEQVELGRRYVERCGDLGLIPTVENSSKQPLGPFVRLFEALPGLKLTLDVKHACKPETLGLTHADYLRELGDRVANLHVSGINRARDPVTGDGTPPGDDLVCWSELAADLAERGYAGPITIETHLPNYLSVAEQEAAYADLPDVDTPENTISERLSAYAAAFYRRRLARAL
jgi:sugar phosphate isomerase/epimerase